MMPDLALLSGVAVPPSCLDPLMRLAALVERWNPTVNLVAKSTVADIWQRHILDSAQILPAAPRDAAHWVDLGTGGGFPGLVVAIIAAKTRPKMRVTLVESDGRKAAFLSEAVREAGIRVDIRAERAEKVAPLAADVVSARALAPLEALLPLVERHVAPDGVALLLKGAGHASECDQAKVAGWRFSVTAAPSRTDPAAALLILKDIRHD
ncbi:MAG TPA: 16S rRNA (guanine(527)-N(7))-methyltransferase RsmG [Paracoccaceae bacterium]|nr:16S rRNA (guanine(527)-N(7))-methyltransferase RsmG [Paracoccaceae bacterium]HMO71274.1 16S rRNA (guanine(527)-N(7))-methyltransferase RsmG [Paracoccaceae bacterium]